MSISDHRYERHHKGRTYTTNHYGKLYYLRERQPIFNIQLTRHSGNYGLKADESRLLDIALSTPIAA